jgi:hypothetical protein
MDEDRKTAERGGEFAERLADVAERAERAIGADAVIVAMLGAAIAYAMRSAPAAQVAYMLRDAAARLERGDGDERTTH